MHDQTGIIGRIGIYPNVVNLISTPDANENRNPMIYNESQPFDRFKPIHWISLLIRQQIGEVVNKNCKLCPVYRF